MFVISPFCVLYFVRYNKTSMTPSGSATDITPPREDCRPWAMASCHQSSLGVLFLLYYPQECHICIVLTERLLLVFTCYFDRLLLHSDICLRRIRRCIVESLRQQQCSFRSNISHLGCSHLKYKYVDGHRKALHR